MRENAQCAENNDRITNAAAQEGRKYPPYLATAFGSLSLFALGIADYPTLPSQLNFYLIPLMQAVGLAASGFLCDEFGAKRAIQMSAFPLFMSRLIVAYCRTHYGYLSANLLMGFTAGVIRFAAINYATEIAEKRRRGSAMLICFLAETLGLLCFQYLKEHVSDFILRALITSVVPVFYLTALSFMPESPVHFCLKDDIRQAKSCLQWLRGSDYDINEEITRIQTQALHKLDETGKSLWTQLKIGAFIVSLLCFLFTYRLYFTPKIDYQTSLYMLVALQCIGFWVANRIHSVQVLQTNFLLIAISVVLMAIFYKHPPTGPDHWNNFHWGWTLLCSVLFLLSILAMYLFIWDNFDEIPTKNKSISLCLCIQMLVYSALERFVDVTEDMWILCLVMNLIGFICVKCFLPYCTFKKRSSPIVQRTSDNGV